MGSGSEYRTLFITYNTFIPMYTCTRTCKHLCTEYKSLCLNTGSVALFGHTADIPSWICIRSELPHDDVNWNMYICMCLHMFVCTRACYRNNCKCSNAATYLNLAFYSHRRRTYPLKWYKYTHSHQCAPEMRNWKFGFVFKTLISDT